MLSRLDVGSAKWLGAIYSKPVVIDQVQLIPRISSFISPSFISICSLLCYHALFSLLVLLLTYHPTARAVSRLALHQRNTLNSIVQLSPGILAG